MKKLIIGLFIVLTLCSAVVSQEVKVNVKGVIKTEIINFKYNPYLKSNEPFKIDFELINTGSLDYRMRTRLDIFDENDLLYTGWSEEAPLHPGESEYFELYWFPVNMTGNFTGKIRLYHSNEIGELDLIELEVKESNTPKNDIEITDFKVYNTKVEVGIRSEQDLKNVVIVPSDYPQGWIFTQTKINQLNKDEEKIIELEYEPTIWKPTEVKIHIFTEDGQQYTTKSFFMERQTVNLTGYFFEILKIFSSFYF